MQLRAVFSRLPGPLVRVVRDAVMPPTLPEGENAPEWSLQADDGAWHRLGRTWAVMVFYPDTEGEADAAQLQAIQALLPEFERLGVKVFGVNPSEVEAQRAVSQRLGLGFPLLSDPGGAVGRLYRACLPMRLRTVYLRTVYLVNPERKIRLANRGAPSVRAILRSVQALQQATKNKM